MRHGEDEPKGYLQWHAFAEHMTAKGYKQAKCKCCGLWFFQWPRKRKRANQTTEGGE